MTSLYRVLGSLVLSVFLALQGGALYAAQDKPADKVIATVNGQPITEQALMMYANERDNGRGNSSVNQQALLNEIITRDLLYQQAVAKGLDKEPDVALAIEQETHNLLAQVAIQDLLRSRQPTETELKAAYDDHVKKMGKTEYHAKHILVKTQDEAKSIIAQLDKGADFSALAKQKSIGPSAKNGGDLGWFTPDDMVKPFAEATMALKKGSYSKKPVHTRFGWHVIKLEDTREIKPPPYDDMKDQLVNSWRNKMIQDYLDKLRSGAKIVISK